MYWLINNLFPTSVGINTFVTTMLLALAINGDGGAPLTTQRTNICLILPLILRGGRVALISPIMRRDMVPRSIRRVTDLPLNAKMCEMQQNTTEWCNSLGAPHHMFLTKPQCHNCPKKCSMRARLYDYCRAVKFPFFLPMNGTMT